MTTRRKAQLLQRFLLWAAATEAGSPTVAVQRFIESLLLARVIAPRTAIKYVSSLASCLAVIRIPTETEELAEYRTGVRATASTSTVSAPSLHWSTFRLAAAKMASLGYDYAEEIVLLMLGTASRWDDLAKATKQHIVDEGVTPTAFWIVMNLNGLTKPTKGPNTDRLRPDHYIRVTFYSHHRERAAQWLRALPQHALLVPWSRMSWLNALRSIEPHAQLHSLKHTVLSAVGRAAMPLGGQTMARLVTLYARHVNYRVTSALLPQTVGYMANDPMVIAATNDAAMIKITLESVSLAANE